MKSILNLKTSQRQTRKIDCPLDVRFVKASTHSLPASSRKQASHGVFRWLKYYQLFPPRCFLLNSKREREREKHKIIKMSRKILHGPWPRKRFLFHDFVGWSQKSLETQTFPSNPSIPSNHSPRVDFHHVDGRLDNESADALHGMGIFIDPSLWSM